MNLWNLTNITNVLATVVDFYLTDHFRILMQVYRVIGPPQPVVPSSFNMRNLHGITDRLYVGRSSPRLWPKQGSHPRLQQVAYLLGSMKRSAQASEWLGDRLPSNWVPNATKCPATECPVRPSAQGLECPMDIQCPVTQKLTQGWLHALTAGLVDIEKEIWF